MRALVEFEPTTVPETFPTLSAMVRLLSGVDAEVPGQRSGVAETLGADGAGVRSLPRVDTKVGLQIFQAVELSVTHGAAEGAAARWVKLQLGPCASWYRQRTTLLEPLAALTVVPPQQAGQVEGLTAELTCVDGSHVTDRPDMDSVDLGRSL